MTPEGRTKARIRRVLDAFVPHGLWYYMPVQVGMGKTTLDFICSRHGTRETFLIEAKAEGQSPTERQWAMIRDARAKGMRVFVIDDERADSKVRYESCQDLLTWLKAPE